MVSDEPGKYGAGMLWPPRATFHHRDELDAVQRELRTVPGVSVLLVEEKRGKQKTFEYVSSSRVMLHYELPLNEIVLDFYDRLKSVSRGLRVSRTTTWPITGNHPW